MFGPDMFVGVLKNSHVLPPRIEAGVIQFNYLDRRIFLISFTAFFIRFTGLLFCGFLLAGMMFIGFSLFSSRCT